MKRSLFILFMAFYIGANAQHYIPTKENLAARETFRNDAFGLFIHWGIFSIPGDGEWVMNDRSEEHTSELQSPVHLVCRLLLEKKNQQQDTWAVECAIWTITSRLQPCGL